MTHDASSFFSSLAFMPHGHCYFWRADLITLHVASDVLIALAYYSIPAVMIYLVRRRADLPFRSLYWLFGSFIVACGTTHLLEAVMVWQPVYWLSGGVKAVTAVFSILCALVLVRIAPQVIELPSPESLQRLNTQLEEQFRSRTADLVAAKDRLESEARQRETAEAEIRRLNESLQQRVTELQTLLDLLPVGIGIAHDPQCRDIRTNQAFAQILGISTRQNASLTASPLEVPTNFKVFHEGRELRQQELPMQRAASENISIHNYEETIVRADGQKLQVLVNAVPLRDADGLSRGCVATVQDITAQKQQAQEQLDFVRKLQEMQKLESLGVLAGGIAHDFNNLLTGILGNASLARLDLPPGHAAVRASLANLEQAALRAADLCKQMLAYSGKGRFVIQTLSLSSLVKDTTELLEVSLGRKSVLQLELAAGLPAFQGDPTQIRQILMNLVINAAESYGEKGGLIVIRTGEMNVTRDYLENAIFHGQAYECAHVFIEVRDDGCGMDPATLARIFDPFFTTKFTGRGLGLAAVLGIVRGHKGVIKVESEPGRGTTFRALFPAIDQPATPPAPVMQAVAMGKNTGCILLVDDDLAVRTVAARILSTAGYEVVMAQDGVQALEIFKSMPRHFTAVLLDLTMPRMAGEDTLLAMRQVNPHIRVMLMSGFNEQETVKRLTQLGVPDFLPKPFSAEILLMRLREMLAKPSTG